MLMQLYMYNNKKGKEKSDKIKMKENERKNE